MKKRFFLTRSLLITRVDGSTHFRELAYPPLARHVSTVPPRLKLSSLCRRIRDLARRHLLVTTFALLVAAPASDQFAQPAPLRHAGLAAPGTTHLHLAALKAPRFTIPIEGELHQAMPAGEGTYFTEHQEFGRRGFTRTFRIEGEEATSSIVSQEGVIRGVIYAPSGMFVVEGEGEAIEIRRAEPQRFVCETRASPVPSEGLASAAASGGKRRSVSSGSRPVVIRTLEVYTADAMAGAGSSAKMEAEILAAIAQTNAIARDSGAGSVQFAPAAMVPTSYVPTNDRDRDSWWLARDSGIALLRRQHGADVVILWTEHGGSAADMPVTDIEFVPNRAFATVRRAGAVANSVYAHEVGHLLGMDHDASSAAGNSTVFPYARGYANPLVKRQTVMSSYFEPQPDGTRLFWHKIPRYSNPDRPYQGFMTGTAMADNARMMREKGPVVARYHLQLSER